MKGDYIGSGHKRDVYVYAPDPRFVIKFEKQLENCCNIDEWKVWQALKNTKYARWLAPCRELGRNGEYLIQVRTKKVKIYPKEIPAFFRDVKKCNWSMLGDEYVCHDYAEARVAMAFRGKMRETGW